MKRFVLSILFLGCVLLCSQTVTFAMSPALMKAYKKEFAFLQAQKQALKKRLKSFEKRSTRRLNRAKGQVSSMQRKILAMENQAEKDNAFLQNAEQANSKVSEQDDRIQRTLEQASYALKRVGIKLPAVNFEKLSGQKRGEAQANQMNMAFGHSFKLIKESGQIRKSKGAFFLPNGRQVKGDLIHVGRIATFGISNQASGALAPAGAGRLKLWPKNATATVGALSRGQVPSSMKLFLYENLEKEVVFKAKKTAVEIVESGGVIAWVIVWLGVVALLMMLLRVLILAMASTRTEKLLNKITPMVQNKQFGQVEDVCKRSRGATARVLAKMIPSLKEGRQRQEELASELVLDETPKIERFGTMITVCAAVAPLLGLLGTVTGMISTFDVITEHGTGDPKMLAGGISEALVTTELGLIVAIPTLLLGTLLSGRAEAILSRMEWAVLRLMNVAHDPATTAGQPLLIEAQSSPAYQGSQLADSYVSKAETPVIESSLSPLHSTPPLKV